MSDQKTYTQQICEDDEDISRLLSAASDTIRGDDREFEMKGGMLLHHLLESVNPGSLIDLLSMITNTGIKTGLGLKGTTVIMTSNHGDMVFSNVDEFSSWADGESEESLILEVSYLYPDPIYIAPKVQASLNKDLVFGRIVVNDNDGLECRTAINFRGGRNAENVLWDILEFSKEALAVKTVLFD